MEIEEENSLCHYGVKGMRWGHHKTSNAVSDAGKPLNGGINVLNGSNNAVNRGINAATPSSSEFLKEKEYNSRKNESLNTQRLKNQDEQVRKEAAPSKNLIEQGAELCSNIIKNIGNILISAISSLFKH